MSNKNRMINAFRIFAIVIMALAGRTLFAQSDTLKAFSRFGGWPDGSAIKGKYAYLIQGTSLNILDITTDEFRRLGSLMLPDEPVDIVIEGSQAYLFVAGSDSALMIVDIANPVAPKLLKTMALKSKRPVRGCVAAGMAYLAQGDSLKIVDAQNPLTPRLKSASAVPCFDIVVRRKLAFIGGHDGLRILNIADPAKPVQLGFLATAGVQGVCVDKEYAYLLGYRTAEPRLQLTVVSIADSTKPKQAGEASATVGKGISTSMPGRIAVANNLAYLTAGNRLYIFDVSQPAVPVKRGELEITEGQFPAFQSLNLLPPLVYAAMGSSDHGFIKIDISNSAKPRVAAALIEPWDVTHFFISGTRIYTGSSERLLVYEYANPDHPKLLGSNTTWPELYRIYVEGRLLYGTDMKNLYVIDVTDPARMVQKGMYAIPAGKAPRAIVVHGTTAWLLTINTDRAKSQLTILDMTDPGSIQVKGSLEFSGEGRDLAVPETGRFAYVAFAGAGGQRLQIIDLANQAKPMLAGSAQTRAMPACIWHADSLVYIGSNGTNQSWYIEAFNVSFPQTPLRVGETSGTGKVVDLETSGDRLFASIRGGSVYQFRLFSAAEIVLLKFITECHSPASIYIGLMWLANHMYAFTCDGAWSIDGLIASASLGIYIQNMFLAYLPVEQSDAPPTSMQIELAQNYPNPFNPSTRIAYTLAHPEKVTLEIYNALGQRVAVLVDEQKSAGAHEFIFNGKGWASGLYFYRLQVGEQVRLKKMLLLE